MLELIKSAIAWPDWARKDPRFKRLEVLDRLLDGRFYDHLGTDFEVEKDSAGYYIPTYKRRPSVQFNLPRQVAIRCARKLFAGRQQPRLVHSDNKLLSALLSLMHEGFLSSKLLQAAEWGSVGSVAITFKILPGGDKTPRIVFETWRSKYCQPTFDTLGELSQLRIHYVATGRYFLMCGYERDYQGEEIKLESKYWFIRDFTIAQEITYLPIPEAEYYPSQNKEPEIMIRLRPIPDQVYDHNCGFVPGHWFVNLSGGEFPDGACTWEPAIPIALHMDYTMSQVGRGLWYNSSPELVIKGELANMEDNPETGGTIIRGPVSVLQFKPTVRQNQTGETIEGGDAKLLEMQGTGLKAALSYIEIQRKYALESIQMSRKDPDKMGSAPLSGRAMEMLEDDFVDLFQELRTAYGDMGLIPLLKKAANAANEHLHWAFKGVSVENIDQLGLQWPKPYQMGSQELLQFSQALIELYAPDPIKTGTATGSGAQMEKIEPLLTRQEARALLEAYVDLPVVEVEAHVRQQEPVPEEIANIPKPEELG